MFTSVPFGVSAGHGGTHQTDGPFVPASNGGWDEWLTLFASRNEVADEYARMMRMHGLSWPGYRYVNAAILRRWSPAGLNYIKERAWKIAAQNL